MRNSTSAIVSFLWRPLADGSRLTRYFYKLTQKKLNGNINPTEALLLWLLRYAHIVPLHLYLCIEYSNGRSRSMRFYGVADGNAVSTDGSLLGTNNTPALVSFTAFTPGSWRVRFRRDSGSLLDWQSSGLKLADIRAAAKRLKLNETEPQSVYEHVTAGLVNEANSIRSHCQVVSVNEAQLNALDALVKSCQSQFHYKLVGNNCQNVAHDILKMIQTPKYKPSWVPDRAHKMYLKKLSVI